MVVMSNYLNQGGKDLNNPVYVVEGVPKSFYNQKETSSLDTDVNKQTLVTAQPVATAHIPGGMPEPYMPANGYYPNTTGFAMSFPNFSQPAQWSTGTSNPQGPPQNFDQTTMQYSALNAPSAQASADGTQNHQFIAADHLFNQNTSAYQNAFSAGPYNMNGNWSYFNNPSSFFFPTGNGDLNLTWGTTTDNPNNALFQDLYKPPPPTEQDKMKIETHELTPGFDNREVKTVESVEKSFSGMNISNNELDSEKVIESSVVSTIPSSSSVPVPSKLPAPTTTSSGQSNAPAKPVSWAAVASQPAKSKVPPRKPPQKTPVSVQSSKSNFSSQNGAANSSSKGKQQVGGRWNRQHQGTNSNNNTSSDVVARDNDSHLDINNLKDDSLLLKKLMQKYNFNPREFNIDLKDCRFFIIKSYSEDDIFRSIKYSSWTSTEHGNRRLNEAFKEQAKTGVKTPMYLLFSVNSSGHFCGVAEMLSEVDINVETGIWVQDKWKGRFDVRWIYVKDVPNNSLRHIRLENNENKPVTNSRDTQEVHPDKGKQVLKIIHNYKAQTSIFDDFSHYEKRQEEDAKMRSKRMPEPTDF